MDIKDVLDKQDQFFKSNITLDYAFRKRQLINLKQIIKKYENEILLALNNDLNKSSTEAYMCEVGIIFNEINYYLKNLKKFMKQKKVKTPLTAFPSTSFIKPSPRGRVLIISPWNYPFLLTFQPLIGAISAGNVVIIKPSEHSINTSLIIEKICNEVFDEGHVKVMIGNKDISSELLNHRFDYIFFTGGSKVGKIVYKSASEFLTPVTLELGGKSPCIIDDNCDLNMTAKKIVFGKFLNAGQTCVAPDYVLLPLKKKEQFISLLKFWVNKMYLDSLNNKDYPRIINEFHFNRLISLIDKEKVILGGGYDRNTNKLEPTILDDISLQDEIMKEEIFGPILPLIYYKEKREIEEVLNHYSSPLACYIFSKDKKFISYYLETYNFGGGCINDTIMHLLNHNLPFGGVKDSGIGSYHGQETFKIFSHYKSIIKKHAFIDVNLRYPPYQKKKEKIIKKVLK